MAIESWAYGWQWRAACRGEDSSTFFPDERESREDRVVREERAKSICAACPVRVDCLEYSLRVHEPYGIWGGLNEQERRVLIRDIEAF
jgi:WhiB family transcriptional regulator, redox-sensing transcriptional regulator